MISILIPIVIAIVAVLLLGVLPWALTYLPGTRTDRDWVNRVTKRTDRGHLYWWEHENRNGARVLRGRDATDELLHELHIHGFSAKFLYSYSMVGAEDDGYTHNKKQRAYIPINPWRPLHLLSKAVLKQIHEDPYGKIVEPSPVVVPTAPLFGLEWGEEPEWRKHA
jgi:hypothetical protein